MLLNMLAGAPYPDPLNPGVPLEEHPVVVWNRRTEFKRTIFTLGRERIGLPSIEGLGFAK